MAVTSRQAITELELPALGASPETPRGAPRGARRSTRRPLSSTRPHLSPPPAPKPRGRVRLDAEVDCFLGLELLRGKVLEMDPTGLRLVLPGRAPCPAGASLGIALVVPRAGGSVRLFLRCRVRAVEARGPMTSPLLLELDLLGVEGEPDPGLLFRYLLVLARGQGSPVSTARP
ncbi:MAG: hypothetical protein FJ098_12390 [Deltaproteobacteria bacterium]|nr:hypothetical protein [Deltaproteobacteria bacterium]